MKMSIELSDLAPIAVERPPPGQDVTSSAEIQTVE